LHKIFVGCFIWAAVLGACATLKGIPSNRTVVVGKEGIFEKLFSMHLNWTLEPLTTDEPCLAVNVDNFDKF